MRSVCMVLAGLMLFCARATADESLSTVSYTLAPELSAESVTALDVRIKMRATGDTTKLMLPDKEFSASDLWRYIRDFHVEGAKDVTSEGDAVRVIHSRPNTDLTISYRVVSAVDHDPGPNESDIYLPTIRPQWFWVTGETVFAFPKMQKASVRFNWKGPRGFPFASSLEERGAMTFDTLMQSIAVGGQALKISTQADTKPPVRIATIGKFDFSDAQFADNVGRIVTGERSFWGTREGPFLVVLAALTTNQDKISDHGEGRDGAFVLMSTTNVPLETMRYTIAHEYFHNWNPLRLGGLYEGEAEPTAYWFSEGFTDYFAWRFLLRIEVYSLEDFVTEWNQMLSAYAQSKAKNAPEEFAAKHFWGDNEVQKLPYQRGAILAAIWDRNLRTATAGHVSLDDVMRTMRLEAQAAGSASPKAPDLFLHVAKRYGLAPEPELVAVVRNGESAWLPEDAFGACIKVRTLTIPIFERGYDQAEARKSGVISGVTTDSAAYIAGLRNGMTLVNRESGLYGDSTVPYTLRVKDGGTERVITYLPRGKTTFVAQRLILPPDLSPTQREVCAREAASE